MYSVVALTKYGFNYLYSILVNATICRLLSGIASGASVAQRRNASGISDIHDSGVDCDASGADVRPPSTPVTMDTLSSQMKTDQHVKFSVPVNGARNIDRSNAVESVKFRDVLSSKSGCSSEELSLPIHSTASSSLGHKLGLLKPGIMCSDLEFVPLEILLTGSKIGLTIYDKKILELNTHKHVKVILGTFPCLL